MSAPRTPAVADPVVVPAGTTAADAVAAAGLPTHGPKAIVVVRDAAGALRDLDWAPEADTDGRRRSRSTRRTGSTCCATPTAHVLAQAVQDVFPEAKLGIGPPIENGFYYDFDVAKPFQPDDLAKLEKRMQEIVKSGQRFRRRRFDVARRGQGRAGRRAVQARAGRHQGRRRTRPRSWRSAAAS